MEDIIIDNNKIIIEQLNDPMIYESLMKEDNDIEKLYCLLEPKRLAKRNE